MIRTISELFRKYMGDQPDEPASEEHFLRAVDIVSVALIIEVIRADRKVRPEEVALLRKTLAEQYRIDDQDSLDEVIELASQEVDAATSLYQFTSQVAQAMGPQGRAHVIYNMWLLAYADHEIHRYEEHLIRQVGSLLHVSQHDFIQAKEKAKADVKNA